ncbi:MAG: glycosyltransferase [Planctomycetota bacterium]
MSSSLKDQSQSSDRARVLVMISSMRGGGSERQVLLLLKHIDRALFEPHLYLLEKVGAFLDRVPSDVVIHSYCDQPSRTNLLASLPGMELRRQRRHLAGVLEKQSIDVIYDRTFRMSLLSHPVASRLRIPRVSTIVSPPNLAVPAVEQRWVGIKRRRLKSAYLDAHAVITVSDQSAHSAADYYDLSLGEFRTIHNGVPLADEMTECRSVLETPVRLVVVGRLGPEKGQVDLMRALQHLEAMEPFPVLEVTFIGDGPDLPKVRAMGEELQRHRTHFLGRRNDIEQQLALADALVLPSHFEGMPNVVLEAMAAGISVIATRSGGTVELQRDEPTIFFAKPGDPLSLADAIRLFIEDQSGRLARRESALRLVRTHHDVRTQTKEIESILASACRSCEA